MNDINVKNWDFVVQSNYLDREKGFALWLTNASEIQWANLSNEIKAIKKFKDSPSARACVYDMLRCARRSQLLSSQMVSPVLRYLESLGSVTQDASSNLEVHRLRQRVEELRRAYKKSPFKN